jgi:hypothetical protein
LNIYFDIETSPIAYDELKASIPEFDETKYPELAPFDEKDVKLGALKDEKKIADKIQQARQKHAESVLERENKLKAAREAHTAKHIDRAALSAVTGRVLMIAVLKDGVGKALYEESDNEAWILGAWWNAATANQRAGHRFIGFNIFHFDLPFLIRRSWKLGVDVPSWVRSGRYWSESFVDLLDNYQMGNRQEFISLDAFDRYLGGAGKTDTGAGFWERWQKDREVAIAYAMNDVAIVERIARRLGVEEHRRAEIMAGVQAATQITAGPWGACEVVGDFGAA